MEREWWKQAKGQMTHDHGEFLDIVDAAGDDKLIIVDFFMPQCSYCVKFMPAWNQIVEEFTAEYGDKVQFLKVDGISDHYSASKYGI